MPFALIAIGLLLTVVAVRDNQDAFYAQLGKDFTGQNSFTNWGVAVLGIGALGYYKPIKPFIDPFIILMIIAFFISNAGGLENLLPAIQSAFDNAKDQLGNTNLPSSGANSDATQTGWNNTYGLPQSQVDAINQAYSGGENGPQTVISPNAAQAWEQANGLPVL